jgi:DUF1680 family protein
MIYDSNKHLQQMVDEIISLITRAQDKNGYVNTYFSLERTNERWVNLQEKHELYCAGHLIQAAIAHQRATSENRLLASVLRLADHIYSQFGPTARAATSGHPEIEMALVELYRMTRDKKYLELASTLINRRGHQILNGTEYLIDHRPFRELEYLAGHAVRALYLCSGVSDIFLETGEPQLITTLQRLWTNMVVQQMYITGGLGARYDGEAFGKPYELPNSQAYAETCAAIASIMWNWRMLQVNGEAQYSDLMEWTYYNAVLPGISLDGNRYFYTNPLRDDGTHRREKWFDCACCPPNVSRIIAEFPGYIYSISDEGIWLHHYANSRARIDLRSGQQVELVQSTRYPWDGHINLRIVNLTLGQNDRGDCTSADFCLFLRIPGWLTDQRAVININNKTLNNDFHSGTYLLIRRQWQTGDIVSIDFPMKVRYRESHPLVKENTGRIAITRGPLVYCLETVDNPGVNLSEIVINPGCKAEVEFLPDLLEGIVRLHFHAKRRKIDPNWEAKLYRPISPRNIKISWKEVEILSIPYYAWANREPGEMEIWHLFS